MSVRMAEYKISKMSDIENAKVYYNSQSRT